ncbi:poly(U)-specific 3'-to-5' RNA exonuclease [Sparganum proliferum]
MRIAWRAESEETLELPRSLEQFVSDEKRFSTQQEKMSSHKASRVRSFPHIHGNWASCVFIPAPEDMSSFFLEVMDAVDPLLINCSSQFYSVEDPHLSLTKTWPILHHWIDDFARFVATLASENARFSVQLSRPTFLTNEEKTSGPLHSLVSQLDEQVIALRGEKYYQDPLFHFSIGWCVGDVHQNMSSESRKACLDFIEEHFAPQMSNHFELSRLIFKSGNKEYIFTLS